MQRIGDIIGVLRTMIRQHTNDSQYTDKFLYDLIKMYRAIAISRDANTNSAPNRFYWQSICISLEQVKFHNCDCVDVGCDVLKSTIDIPQVVVANKKPLIKVHTFGNVELPYVTPFRQVTNRYSEILSKKPAYYIDNNKLVIWNNLELAAIQVSGIWSDPLDLETIGICDESGNEYDVCSFDPREENFPLEERLIPIVLDYVKRDLGFSLQIREDKTNNSLEPA